MIVIIKSILNLSSILIIGVYFFFYKRNRHYGRDLFYKRCGIECFKCSSEIIDPYHANLENQDNLSLCKSCNRDQKIKNLLKKINLKYYIYKFVLSRKSEYITIGFVLVSLIILLISMFTGFTNYISMLNSSIIISHWVISIYRIIISKNKKSYS
jgi:hypothetical protein